MKCLLLSMELDDAYFMQKAYEQAELAFEMDEVPVGAVVVIDQRIIARAHNLTERLKDVTAHAEMQAITAAAHFLNGKYLKGCTLYVTLEPCVMCMGALYWSQLDRVVFGASDPKSGVCGSTIDLSSKPIFNHQISVSGGVLEHECKNILQSFFKLRRK